MCELITKVGQFQFAVFPDEKILRLQVSMQHAPLVAERQATQQLKEEELKQQHPDDVMTRLWWQNARPRSS